MILSLFYPDLHLCSMFYVHRELEQIVAGGRFTLTNGRLVIDPVSSCWKHYLKLKHSAGISGEALIGQIMWLFKYQFSVPFFKARWADLKNVLDLSYLESI